MSGSIKIWLLRLAIVAALAGLGVWGWQSVRPEGLPEGYAASNGRIEAVEIDIAARTAGRVKDILVNEGDFVRAGQVLAIMDTAVLEAQLREAEVQLQRSEIGIETALSLVTQREAEIEAAQAVVAQRTVELDAEWIRTTSRPAAVSASAIPARSKRAISVQPHDRG